MEHWACVVRKMNALFRESDYFMKKTRLAEARLLNDNAQSLKARLLEEGAPLVWDKQGMASIPKTQVQEKK